MPPQFKLAMIFSKLVRQHGSKVLHSNNLDLLTRDLGDALRRQKKVIQDPDMGVIETTYEALPVILEVKLLTMAVAKKCEIDTKGLSTIAVLEEIVRKTEERNSAAATEIKTALEWTREFFSKPEIQEILKADLIQVEAPRSWRDIGGMGKAAMQGTQRLAQEFSRLQDFLTKAKEQNTAQQHKPPKSQTPDT